MSLEKSTIATVECYPVGIPMIRGFSFASGSAGGKGDLAPHLFVRIVDSEGREGWGEGRPVPQWSYETMGTVHGTVRDYLAPAVVGLSIWDREGLQRAMHRAIGRGPSTGQPVAKAAVDMALHDLCARVAGVSLREFLGGTGASASVALSWTITAHDLPEVDQDFEEGQALGMQHFNFKPGVRLETDLEIALRLRELMGSGGFLWADANQGLPWPQAVRLAQGMSEAGVDLLEQPLPADQMDRMRDLRSRTSLPLAIDEASVSPSDFFHYAAHRLVDYLVVKVTRSGGLLPSQKQIAVAEAAGLPIILSGLTDGLLTKVAACQLVAAHGFAGPAALNGSQFLDESELFPEKEHWENGGSIHLGENQPGIGPVPDAEGLSKLAWINR